MQEKNAKNHANMGEIDNCTVEGRRNWNLYLEPTKFVILRIFWIKFGDFCKICNLVKFEILNPKISKFEILNPNTKISNLDTKCLNFGDFCYKFEENFKILPKLTKLVISRNLKSLTLKSKI